MQQNDVFSTLEWTAIDMDNEFTVGFDVGFDFRTGWEKCGLFDLSYFCPLSVISSMFTGHRHRRYIEYEMKGTGDMMVVTND
jgi:hypothetical protein